MAAYDVNALTTMMQAESVKAGTQGIIFGMWSAETNMLSKAKERTLISSA
ncbi:MAG: hypothetical protein ABIZ64_11135 [Casimicrobium sp.]